MARKADPNRRKAILDAAGQVFARKGYAKIDAQAVASALIGTWDALLLQAWLFPDFDALATSRSFLEVVLRGLQPTTSA